MSGASLTVALISEVFWQPDGEARLAQRLVEAAAQGAELALLPELPLNAWRPATKTPKPDDAEAETGRRTRAMAGAAREAGIGLIGGIIHRDPATGRRTSRALVFGPQGDIVARYEKIHLPDEPGFWETSHYEPGTECARPVEDFGLSVGLQICSDINRPEGSHLLGAQGAEVILAPRATEQRTYERWRIVFGANALTSSTYVLSVNRPEPEEDVLIGGPSIAVDPNGRPLVETTDRLALVTLDRDVVRRARRDYPGYLPIPARLYARAWTELAAIDGIPTD
ncbi:MAG TPA: carbon-nitrogen hydrolase family protein [Candidatus Caenarcaniphilales bacterium]|nr:carbon-nitrogen hydrolase family protein [Candidatus Caenarcaniphilales bacterium]